MLVVCIQSAFRSKSDPSQFKGIVLKILLEKGDRVFAFFSSISYHLEGLGNWGERFPRLLIDLCDHGIVYYEDLGELVQELKTIQQELQQFTIDDAVYDIADLSKPIPWERYPDVDPRTTLAEPWIRVREEQTFFEAFYKMIFEFAIPQKSPLYMGFFLNSYDQENPFKREKKGRDYWLRIKR